MIRHASLACAFVFAAPAVAQNTQEPATSPPAAPTQPPTTSQPPATQSPQTSVDVGQVVQAEFPARDRDGNGSLNQAEFSAWVSELLARAPGQSAPPSAADLQTRAAAAFTQADTDRNQSISPAEMTALFSRTR